MKVKKYRAADRASALKQVKAEMGADAVILQEQQVRSGPMGLFGKPEIEITAALEEGEAPVAPRPARIATTSPSAAGAPSPISTTTPPNTNGEVQATISSAGRRAARAASATGATPAASQTTDGADGASRLAAILAQLPKDGGVVPAELAASLAEVVAQSADGRLGDLLAASAEGHQNGATPAKGAEVVMSARGGALTVPVATMENTRPAPAARGPQTGLLQDMERSLVELRAAVERIKQQSQPAKPSREPAALRTVYQRLMNQEVEPGLALELMGQVAEEVVGQLEVNEATVQRRLRELLSAQFPTRSLAAQRQTRKTPRVIVLVGPTGVGKTTTVAKLAAHLSLQDEQQVCLVTTDTFRIAAAAQLGTYADIMRLPLEVVYAPAELPAAIDKHADADYVIVDTPGCGQHNEPQLRELQAFVEGAVHAAPDATVLLAVAAPIKLTDMLDVQKRFGTLHVDGLVLTKLDETSAFGPLLSLVRRAEKPVCYVTTGQNVPNDIAEATPEQLAGLVVAGSLDVTTQEAATPKSGGSISGGAR